MVAGRTSGETDTGIWGDPAEMRFASERERQVYEIESNCQVAFKLMKQAGEVVPETTFAEFMSDELLSALCETAARMRDDPEYADRVRRRGEASLKRALI